MSRAFNLPIPLKGLNTVDPFTQDLGYARQLTDFQIYEGKLSPRPSFGTGAIQPPYTTAPAAWFDYSAMRGIATNGDTVNLNTGAVTGTIGGNCQAPATTVNFNGTSLLFGCREPRTPTSPFTAWSFTTAAITATAIVCGCEWKGRLYVTDGNNIEYSNLGATGSSTLNGGVPISYSLGGETVIRMLTFTASTQANQLTDSLFAVFGSGGRVLIYSGTDPTDWVQVADYKMAAPPTTACFVETDGDVFIATKKYAYWARDLFIGGAIYAYENSPSKPIENLWTSLLWDEFDTSEFSFAFAFLLKEVNGAAIDYIVISAANGALLTNILSPFCLAYSKRYKAWSVWTEAISAPVIVESGASGDTTRGIVYYGTGSGSFTIAALEYNNQFFDLSLIWLSPYLFPFSSRSLRLLGSRSFYKHRGDSQITVGAIADYSDANAPLSWLPTQGSSYSGTPGNWANATINIVSNSYNVYSPYVGIGLIGSSLSLFLKLIIPVSEGEFNRDIEIFQMVGYVQDGGDLF